MAQYVVMNAEQRAMANKAAEDIQSTITKHHPMAAFEALCTVLASTAFGLGLDLDSAFVRMNDRYAMMKGIAEAEDPEAYIEDLRAKAKAMAEAPFEN